jgi:hypothetical protein
MAGQPVNKWIQSIFWFISALPSFGHIPQHSTGDYVGRTSPILGTAFAFWIVLLGTIAMWLTSSPAFSTSPASGCSSAAKSNIRTEARCARKGSKAIGSEAMGACPTQHAAPHASHCLIALLPYCRIAFAEAIPPKAAL